jgi:hypothetical protein
MSQEEEHKTNIVAPGKIRVGRCKFQKEPYYKRIDPKYEGFTPIVVMTSKSGYGTMSPYNIKDEQGRIMENNYQFCKIYKRVPAISKPLGKWSKLIWNHPAEVHITEDNKITPEYIAWRKKGRTFTDAVRYPLGYNERHKCVGFIKDDPNPGDTPILLNYIEARKQAYGPMYEAGLEENEIAHSLKKRYLNGESFLIIEVDVAPHRSLQYYKDNYGVGDDFIEGDTQLITKEVLKIMINDPKEQCGHGYFWAKWMMGLSMEEIDQSEF